MKTSVALAGTMATVALGAVEPKNLIFIVPDGMGPASLTAARTYLSLTENGSNPKAPKIEKIAVDLTVRKLKQEESKRSLS